VAWAGGGAPAGGTAVAALPEQADSSAPASRTAIVFPPFRSFVMQEILKFKKTGPG